MGQDMHFFIEDVRRMSQPYLLAALNKVKAELEADDAKRKRGKKWVALLAEIDHALAQARIS